MQYFYHKCFSSAFSVGLRGGIELIAVLKQMDV